MSERGIFTTIAIRGGEPFLWAKHWSRLEHAAAKLSIDLSGFRETVVKDALQSKLAEDAIQSGRAKITFTDLRPSSIWPAASDLPDRTSLSVVTGPQRKLPDSFRLGISPFPVNSRSPLAGLKTTNYLEPTLCFEAARKAGFDEAIRLNEQGRVTSACFANVFWLSGSTLFTPELSTGCLAGTTREFILDNFDVREVTAKLDDLLSADAVFLTSAGIGVVQAASLGERTFPSASHPISASLKA